MTRQPGQRPLQIFGKILVNPSIGLLFINFEADAVCLINGTAKVETQGKDEAADFVHRKVVFQLETGLIVNNALKMKWTFNEASPFLPNNPASLRRQIAITALPQSRLLV